MEAANRPTGTRHFRGTVPRDFLLLVFFMNQFPKTPEYNVSNFFKNSRRYSQLKVHHRCCWHQWEMEKIFNQKNFNYFVWTPLGSRVNIYVNFCLQVHLNLSAVWYWFHYLPPVSCRRWQFTTAAGIIDTGGNFATSINNTSHQCHWYRWCTLTYEYLRDLLKIFETVLLGYSGVEGKLFMKKPEATNLVKLSL